MQYRKVAEKKKVCIMIISIWYTKECEIQKRLQNLSLASLSILIILRGQFVHPEYVYIYILPTIRKYETWARPGLKS